MNKKEIKTKLDALNDTVVWEIESIRATLSQDNEKEKEISGMLEDIRQVFTFEMKLIRGVVGR